MSSLVVSTITYFVAAHYLRLAAEDYGIPKGATRTISVMVCAIALSYAVAWMVDRLVA